MTSSPRSLPAPLDRIVEHMSIRLNHRGPDASGLWKSPSGIATLAHRRLAIIDLTDTGRQPMSFADRLWIVFNGEIYNFRDLRLELLALGCIFRGESDTEVLLAAVAQWGIEPAVRKLVGMFAFALWDERDRVLHLGRDRMGEKPLYIAEHSGYLFFASELRAFRAIPGFHPRVSGPAVGAFLRDGCVSGHRSLFEGVYKLPPAHLLSVSAGSGERLSADWGYHRTSNTRNLVSPRPYWSCISAAQQGRHSLIRREQEATIQGEELLRQAVRLQAYADVPTGAFLSGGIDSSLVTALMQSQCTQPIRTFTVGFDDSRFDESQHARAISAHLGTRHEEYLLSEREILGEVPAIARWMDEPTANPSFFPVYLISRLARAQVTVVLSGDGGDELFGGYNRYALAPRVWRLSRWIPAMFRRPFTSLIEPDKPQSDVPAWARRVANLGTQVGSADARRKFARVLGAGDFRDAYERLTAWWVEPSNLIGPFEFSPREWPAHFQANLSSMLLADQMNYLPDDNLAKVDRASMASSLETRLPLLDHRIVEFSWRLPDSMKLHGGTTKRLLREILGHYLPRHLYERPKMGFSVPLDQWLRGALREWATAMLESSVFYNMFPFSQGKTRTLWNAYQSGTNPSANEMWSLVILGAWANATHSEATDGNFV